MPLFTIVFENEAGIYTADCLGVDVLNVKVKEIQGNGFTILDVIEKEV